MKKYTSMTTSTSSTTSSPLSHPSLLSPSSSSSTNPSNSSCKSSSSSQSLLSLISSSLSNCKIFFSALFPDKLSTRRLLLPFLLLNILLFAFGTISFGGIRHQHSSFSHFLHQNPSSPSPHSPYYGSPDAVSKDIPHVHSSPSLTSQFYPKFPNPNPYPKSVNKNLHLSDTYDYVNLDPSILNEHDGDMQMENEMTDNDYKANLRPGPLSATPSLLSFTSALSFVLYIYSPSHLPPSFSFRSYPPPPPSPSPHLYYPHLLSLLTPLKGHISNNEMTDTYGSMKIKIPSIHFVDTVEKIKGIFGDKELLNGDKDKNVDENNKNIPFNKKDNNSTALIFLSSHLNSERSHTNDLTRPYFDSDIRLSALRASSTQYLTMMSKANSVKDMLSIQREMDRVNGEIEIMMGKMKKINEEVTYSTINIDTMIVYSDKNDGEISREGEKQSMFQKIVEFLKHKIGQHVNTLKECFMVLLDILFYMVNNMLWIVIVGFPVGMMGIGVMLIGMRGVRSEIGRKWMGWGREKVDRLMNIMEKCAGERKDGKRDNENRTNPKGNDDISASADQGLLNNRSKDSDSKYVVV